MSDKSEKVNVIWCKWGSFYPAYYVNRLYAGIKRHLKRDFRFVCFTDDPTGLVDGVEALPFPPEPPNSPADHWPTIFVKLAMFMDGCGDLKGPTLFLDIDQIIIGDMDRFFDYKPGEFCIIHNWIERRKQIFRRRPNIGNSSCFRFEAGKMNRVWETFVNNQKMAYDRSQFPTEQAFMTYAVGLDQVNWWPEEWVASFKRHCHRIFPLNLLLPPKKPVGASILCFHGRPNPGEAAEGYVRRDGKKAAIHQRTLPAPWIMDLWEHP